jgi:glycosyltransferase involved in cell wall biosynthesis
LKKTFDLDVEIVRQPFERKLLPPLVEKKVSHEISVVFPHRFSTNKHPETTYDFFSNKVKSNVDWDLHFYGSRNESVIRWTFLKNEIDVGSLGETIFKDKRVWLHESYTPIVGIPKLYQSTNLTAHSTKYKEDGGRMEYTLLESIHYGNPILSYSPFWLNKLTKEQIDDAWIEGISYLEMNEENVIRYAKDPEFRERILSSSNKIVDQYFNAKNSAKQILDLVF